MPGRQARGGEGHLARQAEHCFLDILHHGILELLEIRGARCQAQLVNDFLLEEPGRIGIQRLPTRER
eukprot:7693669-Lingulodinium_polyedra.AAC.1